MSQNNSKTQAEDLDNNAMAIRLQNHHFEAPASDANFKRELRERLLAQYEPRPAQRSWRWAMITGMVVLVIVFGLFWPFQSAQPVSAAELLQLSSEALAAQAADADIIYDRLRLDWDTTGRFGSTQSGIEAELWVYPDKLGLRYQLTKDDVYYYFEQHLGDRHWESLHNQPVGDEPVSHIYAYTGVPYANSLQDIEKTSLLFGDYVNAWLNWGSFAMERQETCDNLFCLIGIDSSWEWECEQQVCTILHPVYDNGELVTNAIFKAEVIGVEQRDGQDDLYVIKVSEMGSEEYGGITIKINASTYMPVEFIMEYEYPVDGEYYFQRLQFLERHGLMADEVPQDLFSTPPQELSVREWPGSLWVKRGPRSRVNPQPPDRVWLISLSPQPETRLDGKVSFQVELGYELVTLPEAGLQVSFRQHPMQVSQPVTAGSGIATFDLVFDTDEIMIAGELRMYGHLVTYTGSESWKDISTYHRNVNDDPHLGRWCVRCDPDELPSIPPSERRFDVGTPSVNLVTTGEPPEGFQIVSMKLEQKRILVRMADPENRGFYPETIDTTPLDLSELTESGRYQVSLVVPEGIVIDWDPFVFVDIVIEPLGETP